jgi:hypothetical protein
VAVSALANGCDLGLDDSANILNETNESIWLASRTQLGEPPDDQLIWAEIPPRKEMPHLPGSGCFSQGIILIATEPNVDAIVDRRNLQEEPWCAGHLWRWSGPGDNKE